MALNETELVLAFRTRLDTVAGVPDANHREYENRPYVPKVDEAWLRETLLPIDEDLTSFGTLEAMGELRYDFFYPIAGGSEAIRVVTKAVAEAFKAGQALQGSGGLEITLERTRRLNLRRDTGKGTTEIWCHQPVVINWRAFTAA